MNGMLGLIVGCLKWAAVGFIVAFVLMKLYEGSHIHDDVPRPDFICRNAFGAGLVVSPDVGLMKERQKADGRIKKSLSIALEL